MAITIKNADQILKVREASKIVAEVHGLMKEAVKPGISTYELDKMAEDLIRSRGAVPSFKGYYGYPASICASINDQVIHGIPSKNTVLQEGDIISVDVGAYLNGYHGDGARTYPVGEISEDAKDLIEVTRNSFFEGIKFAKEGNHLHEISSNIQKYVESHGYSVVRDFVGHGIGESMHEDPQIPNYKVRGRGPKLQKGMTLAIEPMVNIGRHEVRVLSDNWTVITIDGSLSAHYEHTILITEDSPELLTQID
ncbi:type I methionyl aminopeptidase [Vallitalea okinawensis]|uniref:type I methionyl aminopeptidase n=1 Tax=Vallitalea okinawensis TaxID=2078660 RepID=UPI000CFC7DB0|nr:type I methionyl aminopeptidase [Vallitalea okinawensis]